MSVVTVRADARIFDAMSFAMTAHGKQARKGIPMPYMCHPMAVSEMLASHYPLNRNLHIAGMLHDVVEDTPTTIEEIENQFGDVVARLVAGVTAESKGLTWREMREKQIAKLAEAERDVQRLKAADMTHNANSMIRDIGIDTRVWGKFSATPTDIAWYYQSAAVVFGKSEIAQEPIIHNELVPAVQKLWFLAYEADGVV